jgi:hypothetical protein
MISTAAMVKTLFPSTELNAGVNFSDLKDLSDKK